MIKCNFILITILFVFNATIILGQEIRFNEILSKRISLPKESKSNFFSFDITEPNLILMPHQGGILTVGYNRWVVSPSKEWQITSFYNDEEEDTFYCIKKQKNKTYFLKSGLESSSELIDTIGELNTLQYRLLGTENYIYIHGISDSMTTEILRYDKKKGALKPILKINHLVVDFDLLGNYMVAIIGNKITLIDLETKELTELFESKNEPMGILFKDLETVIISMNEGILTIPLIGDKKAKLIKTEETGPLYKFYNKVFLHSLSSHQLFILDL